MKNINIIFLIFGFIIYSCSTEEAPLTPNVTQTPNSETPPVNQYTLTVNTSYGGSVSTQGGSFNTGSQVTITATQTKVSALLNG